MAPLTLLVAGWVMPSPAWFRAHTPRDLIGPGLQAAGLVIAILMAKVAGLDWVPIPPSATNSHTLSGYYGGAARAAFDPTWRTTWLDDFDYRVAGDAKVVAWITRNGFGGDTAVVWSYDAWIYALANLQIIMPTPPIYNDEVLLGSGGPVEAYVAAKQPVLIMVDVKSQVLFPEITTLLNSGEYIDEYQTLPVHRLGPRRQRLAPAVSSRVRHLDRVMLGAVIAVFAGFAIAYTRITPLGASPDELSHLHYITGISDHLRLPPAGEPERQQPPLYYLLGAIVARLTGDDARLIRLVSVVSALLTILTVYLRGPPPLPVAALPCSWGRGAGRAAPRDAVPGRGDQRRQPRVARRRAAGARGDRGDAEQRALDAPPRSAPGSPWRSPCWPRRPCGCWRCLVIVVVRFSRRLRALQVAALVLPSVVFAGWWFVRNAVAFGSPLPPLHPITAQRQVLNSLSQVRGYLAATALSIVGMYGNGAHFVAISILGARPLPSIVAGAVIALITLAACIAVARSWGRWDTMRRRVAIVLLVVILVALAQSVLNSATFDLQPQARYLLVAVGAAAPITAWTIAWRRRGPLSPARCGGIAVLVVVALLLDVSGLITAATRQHDHRAWSRKLSRVRARPRRG